jgi:hypothetical protein
VGDRLVAGHTDSAFERPRGTGCERGRLGVFGQGLNGLRRVAVLRCNFSLTGGPLRGNGTPLKFPRNG